jgi:hypothetical protein
MHALKFNATIDSRRRLELELPPDTPEGTAEVIVLLNGEAIVAQTHGRETKGIPQTTGSHSDESLTELFAAIDAMPRRRLTKEEIDQYIEQERASWE